MEQLAYEGSPCSTRAWDYLLARGFDVGIRHRYRLGVVGEPTPGHEMMTGRLAIPYLTPAGVVDIKFRCIADHSCKEANCPKYLATEGGGGRLYNARAVLAAEETVVICEGEFDAMAVSALAGIPAVGFPGAGSWRDKSAAHWPRVFAGLDAVVVADGDKPGAEAAKTVARSLDAARIVHMPDGEDSNSMILKEGPEAFKERIGI
jgi:DNA primase